LLVSASSISRISQWGILVGFWGGTLSHGGHWSLGAKPQAAGGLETKPPASGGKGVWDRAPSRRGLGVWRQCLRPPETRGSGGRSSSAERFFAIFQ